MKQNINAMKFLKIGVYGLLVIILVVAICLGTFIYKAKYGINIYETTPHELSEKYRDRSILVLSKTIAFRHGEAIEASKAVFEDIALRNNWNIYMTEDAGIINVEQLNLFDVVVCNNCTGKVMNPDQRAIFKSYILAGGGFMGIHGAGDDSHQWEWYTDTLIGARFSHHPIEFQIQSAELNKEMNVDSSHFFNSTLPSNFTASDEWYVFYESPRGGDGVNVLYTLAEANLSWDGSLGPFLKYKNYGMGEDHPIVWYRDVGEGRSIYTAMGHNKVAWENPNHRLILETGMRWAGGNGLK